MRVERMGWALLGLVLAALAGCVGVSPRGRGAASDQAGGWAGARWIADGRPQPTNDAAFYADDPAPLFRKRFAVGKEVRSATLRIVGLGFYEAALNGETLNWGLLPPWTPFGQRVLYDTYDVTQTLRPGVNALSVELGNGWYNPLPLRMWGRFNLREALTVGRPCLIASLQITYADGSRQTVVSDASWRTAPGPIVRNSIYLGETCDARLDPGTLAGPMAR